ncbi:MAG: hypothetical protein LCH85_15295 [Chloroflexi bacterium]|nr:hypothetical protein [Chloroflexota bacterium]
MDSQQQFTAASHLTADNLRSIAHSISISQVSRLSLPEIDAVVDQISRVVPAGNVPGVILSGLAKLTGRRPAGNVIKRDVNLLFRGVEQALDKAVFSTFFAGPAAVIWGYQKLLELAGKDPQDAFPEGTWQFYVGYALREDTARHANETIGFDETLNDHKINLPPIDRMTAWVMAAIHILHSYPDLLENEWRERVSLALLRDLTKVNPETRQFADLYNQWERQRPYGRGPDVQSQENYALYRKRKFDEFMAESTRDLPKEIRERWGKQFQRAREIALPAYQRQMALAAYLDPTPYNENMVALPRQSWHIGLIWRGHYYLIPACAPNSTRPNDVSNVRSQIAALLASPANHAPTSLIPLATTKRTILPSILGKLRPETSQQLEALRCAPIWFNADGRPRHLPLAELRLTERGLGDHGLTLIDTGSSMVFDQSHIFFDGAWGSAVAEIMTLEALAWAVYLRGQPAPVAGTVRPYAPNIELNDEEKQILADSPKIVAEASAESIGVDLKKILELRKLFKQRNDQIRITVNDILVLYRAIHAVSYKPNPELQASLQEASNDANLKAAVEATITAFEESLANPAILIPVDGSIPNPSDRLHPMTFEVPLEELEISKLHERALGLLDQARQEWRAEVWDTFEATQKHYLATIAGFGEVSARAKDIAQSGESTSSGALRLLAHVPMALQRLLDAIPGKFDVLNDLIKGREVLSNVGAVADTSSLTRFITAKDDNEKKTLAWGVITDANGVMHVSLRDFRPHVGLFVAAGRRDLARRIANDYLESYVNGINRFISELTKITQGRHSRQ